MFNMLLMKGLATICTDTSGVLQLVGYVLTVFKIAIPLIIIALGLIDLGKAAVSSKPEEIKKTATSLLWRFVGGIAIFFIPSIVLLVFGFVTGYNNATSEVKDWNVCKSCIITPWDGNAGGCKSAVAEFNKNN